MRASGSLLLILTGSLFACDAAIDEREAASGRIATGAAALDLATRAGVEVAGGQSLPASRPQEPRDKRHEEEEVTCARTAMSGRDLAVVLARGHVARFGREPEERRLLGAWSLAALEGHRGERLYGYNIGNLMPAKGMPSCLHPTASEAGRPVRLRMFSTPSEGAEAFWAALGPTSGPLFADLDQGRWLAFADALAERGFHRAEPERYRDGLPRLAESATQLLLPRLRGELAAREPSASSTELFGAYSRLPVSVFVSKSSPVHIPKTI